MKPDFFSSDTIVAPATPPGVSALAIVRLSGKESFTIVDQIFKGKKLLDQPSHTAHYGTVHDGGEFLDEVVATVYKNPKSFTGEDMVEISSHGSPIVVRKIIELLIKTGARSAQPGEFTRRAFVNGKLDLIQAEAIADLIHAEADLAHKAALTQLKGGFSEEIKALRSQLVDFASLIELELDFSEEDVEFADRQKLKTLVEQILEVVHGLIQSFRWGNVVKNGIVTVIAGKPNAGKSTLLNALLNEEKAIVSAIPGTTRDYIEDEVHIEGLTFRFVDTAGLRDTLDEIETIGVQRSREQITKADLVILLADMNEEQPDEVIQSILEFKGQGKIVLPVGNKVDLLSAEQKDAWLKVAGLLPISAKSKTNLEVLKSRLLELVRKENAYSGDLIVTNARHYECLSKTYDSLSMVLKGLDEKVTGDLLAVDIRAALNQLGEITGEITNDELLGNIFSRFCIGK